MGFDDERTDEFDEQDFDSDEFEIPEEAKDQSIERQNKLRKEVYPKTFGYTFHYAESEEGHEPI